MSIRTKSLLLIGIGIVCIVGTAIYVSTTVFLKRFDELEMDRTRVNLERVSQAFDVEKNNLSVKLSDWSTWDDAYEFIEDQNSDFIESNLQDLTFENLNIYSMIFAKPGEKVVYAKGYDAEGELSASVSAFLRNLATNSTVFGKLEKQQDALTGVVVDNGIPFLLSARPVLRSSSEGSSRGILIFLRKISKTYAKEFGDIVRLPVEIQVIDPSNTSEHIKNELAHGVENHAEVESKDTLEADHFESDIFGKPALYFHMELPRDIHAQGIQVVTYIGIFGSIIGVVMLIIILVVLDRLVLHRIITASDQIVALGKRGIVSERVPQDSQADEISSLVKSVNTMLQSLEYGQHLLADERYRMQQYIDSAGVMFIALSPQGEVILVNKKTCEVLEKSKDELIGKDWFTHAIPTDNQEATRAVFTSIMSGTNEFKDYFENSVITKSGAIRLIAWHNSVLKNSSGEIIAAISSGDDITERKETEKAIEQKNRELESTKSAMLNILEDERKLEEQVKDERDQAQAIISSMSEGLFVVNREYKVLLTNAMASELVGIPIEDIIGKKLSDITVIYNADTPVEETQRPLYRTLHNGEHVSYGLEDNHYLESKHGKIPVAISTTPLRRGDEIIGALATFHDISKDKAVKETIENQVEERTHDLVREQARFMASIRNLPLGFIMTDVTGKVVLINSIARKILNNTQEQLTLDDVAKSFEGIIDILGESKVCTETRKSKQLSSVQYNSRWVRLFIAPIITQGEVAEVIGQVYVLEDTTESKMVERSKDEFFSIASHELRTPLTAIRGNTSMIIDFYGDKITDPDLKEMISDIHASSLRLIDIVNDFLNVSRIEQGKIDFKNTEFDLKDLIRESVAEFEGSALEKHVVVRFADNGDIPHVYADRDRTKQVLLNLIGNALKFTETGEVVVSVTTEHNQVKTMVIDSGRGISKENQSLLFRKFQQAGSSLFTRDTTKGTGLGLYISRLIIEGMGGRIWLEKSEEGVGSEFCFTVPVPEHQI